MTWLPHVKRCVLASSSPSLQVVASSCHRGFEDLELDLSRVEIRPSGVRVLVEPQVFNCSPIWSRMANGWCSTKS
jgi:hypothetical protein